MIFSEVSRWIDDAYKYLLLLFIVYHISERFSTHFSGNITVFYGWFFYHCLQLEQGNSVPNEISPHGTIRWKEKQRQFYAAVLHCFILYLPLLQNVLIILNCLRIDYWLCNLQFDASFQKRFKNPVQINTQADITIRFDIIISMYGIGIWILERYVRSAYFISVIISAKISDTISELIITPQTWYITISEILQLLIPIADIIAYSLMLRWMLMYAVIQQLIKRKRNAARIINRFIESQIFRYLLLPCISEISLSFTKSFLAKISISSFLLSLLTL